jgi:DNA-binding transcriptional ArsR family regulator
MTPQAEAMMKNVRAAADLMKSLANPNRLSIVCCLVNGEFSVSELEILLEIRQPTLSQQLAELREAGLVTTRRDAKQIFYNLTDARAGQMIAALEEIFCDDETRSLLKSRSQPAQKANREPARLALGSSQFAKVHIGGRSPK